jgi:hypothetical protein
MKMTTAQRLVQAWAASRTFRQTKFPSKRNPSLPHETTIFWGGTLERPNIVCTCPLSTFQRKLCGHAEQMWNELDQFAKLNVIHHDEIVAKPWYKPKQSV